MSSAEGSHIVIPSIARCARPSETYIPRFPTTSIVSRVLLALLGLLVFGVHNAAALTQKYCSSLNTGANLQPGKRQAYIPLSRVHAIGLCVN